jgi:hypothetical protein
MAGTPTKRWIRVSVNGNASGQAIVRLPDDRSFLVSVIPKLWVHSPDEFLAVLNLDDLQSPCHVVVPERSYLCLECSDGALLNQVVSDLTDWGMPQNGQSLQMFSEVSSPGPSVPSKAPPAANFIRMVDGVLGVGHDPVDQFFTFPQDQQVESWLAAALSIDLPALDFKSLVRRILLRELESIVSGIRPRLEARQRGLVKPKGRILVAESARARARGSAELSCRFGSLEVDHPLTRLFRCAARTALREEGDDETRARFRALDRRLTFAAVVGRRESLRAASQLRLGRKEQRAKTALEIARIYLRSDQGWSIDGSGGVRRAPVLGVVIDTPKVFEALVGSVSRRGVAGGSFKSVKPAPIALRSNQVAESGKRPDHRFIDSEKGLSLLCDAKYKIRCPGSLDEMPTGDQYQQYAYAAASGLPALFVYAARPSEETTGLTDSNRILVQGHSGQSADVHLATVRFPAPESLDWVGDVGTQMDALLVETLAVS